jgi:pimeloyl-[acyl-carrier protein] methyl ester esterase
LRAKLPKVHIESVGRGPPVILLHGWALHGGLFSPLVTKLFDQFTVYCIDLPGHGHSPMVAPFDLPNLIAEIDDATAHIDAPLNVLGWSFGGMVAQAWALAAPQRIARLVLCCTKPKFVKTEAWPHGTSSAVLQSLVDDFSRAPRETMDRFLAINVAGSEEARAALTQIKSLAHARPAVQQAAMREGLMVLTQFDVRARLHEIVQPTLVITGGLDRLTHPSIGAYYQESIPAAQLLHIARAAHAPHLSHTQEVALALRQFAR